MSLIKNTEWADQWETNCQHWTV